MSGLLLHSPAHIVSRVLINHGLASDPTPTIGTWPVIVGREIDKPDNAITIRNTTGRDSGFIQVSGELTEMEGILIKVRGSTEDVAHARARIIAVTLDQEVEGDHVSMGGTTYVVHSVDRVGGVISLGKEQTSSRHAFTINFVVTVYPYVDITNNVLDGLGNRMLDGLGNQLLGA